MQHACTSNRPPGGKKRREEKVSSLYNNLKAWNLYVDLLENLGSVENTKAAYDRMMELKIATP